MPVYRITRFLAIVSAAFFLTLAICRGADLFSEADAAFKAGQYDAAIAKYSEAMKRSGRNAITYNNRALAYRGKKDYSHALTDFGESLRLKKDWSVYYNRGVTYQDMGDQKAAIADLTQAIRLSPPKTTAHADCLIARAHCYFDQTETTAALADLNAAIKIGVDEPDAYVLRGILHKAGHEYEQSLADYEKAIALDPRDARSYDVAAFLLSVCPAPKYRNGKKAISYATKACELTKWHNARDVETLAAAYAEAGDFDQAIHWQKKATEIDPKVTDPKLLALYQAKQPRRELNRKEEPIPNLAKLERKISIRITQQMIVQLDVGDDGVVQPRIVQTADGNTSILLSLDFREEKAGRVLLLSHRFGGIVQARCLARLKGWDAYFETDILPIPANRTNREVWSDPIDELVLFDFKIKSPEENDQSTQLSEFNRRQRTFMGGQNFVLGAYRSLDKVVEELEDQK